MRRFLRHPSSYVLLVAFLALGVGLWESNNHYSHEALWPGFAANFGATLIAFLIALTWERDREHDRTSEELAKEQTNLESENQKRKVELEQEAAARLRPVHDELHANVESVEYLQLHYPSVMSEPPIPLQRVILDGTWAANAPRLSELLLDSELVSDLAAAYGRLEELRWELRERTRMLYSADNPDFVREFSERTRELMYGLAPDLRALLERVADEADNPQVRLGVVFILRGSARAGFHGHGTLTSG